ncbi:hypothetical protein IDJ77_22870 [Mucilaginibacter sp. ZT4R22]|uniref:PH (Pleckstrin Homology) domain-containing protein n=1 Tax=Mucilaginibacter pankratovii TaxID=2772110 RepID=A0ABR7WWK8_9SPHI|nr:hypothetical protein [Mucilaginibacter pankratovii]MBD1366673.1 hypothetical protein [Mucilaginibacter pankratovii]
MTPVKNFAYSTLSVYPTFCFSLFGFYLYFTANHENGTWDFSFISVIAGLIGITLFGRFVLRVFIPTIKGKSALTLDEEKLYYRVGNKTVYWQDVAFIARRPTFSNRGTYIAFELMDTTKEIHLTLIFLNTDDDQAYDAIQKYFAASLIADGQLGYTANNDEV